eukprot:TRINITY_DN12022_c0_g1_i3.p1 TRINITY_DN12022_c0_g1~~TRINITY_DN12022_c0_g1_i3.p1  ORF type:complete len:517 (-),score=67.13 TRINITY_DN12022_c0_g1_i3:23-1573(-)
MSCFACAKQISTCPERQLWSAPSNHAQIFGLGNSSYPNFNAVAKRTHTALLQLGATVLPSKAEWLADFKLGMQSVETTFDDWQTEAWATLAVHIGTPTANVRSEIPAFNARGTIKDFPEQHGTKYLFDSTSRVPAAGSPGIAVVKCNDEMLHCTGRSTKHMVLDISAHRRLVYEAGDHVAIYPANPLLLVEEYLAFIDLGGRSADSVVAFEGTERKPSNPCAIREVLKWHYDLRATPSKQLLKCLSNFVTDREEHEAFCHVLLHDRDAYATLAGECTSVAAWRAKFPSLKIPLAVFLEVMPWQKPRFYSVASDVMMNPNSLSICYTHVPGGICTEFLGGLRAGDGVPFFVRPNHMFHISSLPNSPMLLIGPGTGIAPFVGFLQRRLAMKAKGKELKPCVLYFGCRHRDQDFVFETFLQECVQANVVTLRTAFSRDQPSKVYVQHLLAEDSGDVWRLLHTEGAAVFVCGDAEAMAPDVHRVLLQIAAEHGQDGVVFLDRLSAEYRYCKDVWPAPRKL